MSTKMQFPDTDQSRGSRKKISNREHIQKSTPEDLQVISYLKPWLCTFKSLEFKGLGTTGRDRADSKIVLSFKNRGHDGLGPDSVYRIASRNRVERVKAVQLVFSSESVARVHGRNFFQRRVRTPLRCSAPEQCAVNNAIHSFIIKIVKVIQIYLVSK
jgi:hypothetical protein